MFRTNNLYTSPFLFYLQISDAYTARMLHQHFGKYRENVLLLLIFMYDKWRCPNRLPQHFSCARANLKFRVLLYSISLLSSCLSPYFARLREVAKGLDCSHTLFSFRTRTQSRNGIPARVATFTSAELFIIRDVCSSRCSRSIIYLSLWRAD